MFNLLKIRATRRICLSAAAASALLAWAGFASTGQALPVRVPGTSVTLDPPAGFTPADRFPGFQRVDMSASIDAVGPVSSEIHVFNSLTRSGNGLRSNAGDRRH